ncbi:hypothetical protein H6A19_11525 [Clostridium saudiense]|uniref:Uncharacterized protein n=1 Tax=Clostridium saudiense TaxID=1414720 RepID=A0ABS2FIY8_9CLOT|nr:hypothetical protein [Clostridium saudiense]MBM6819956.1 hypothetical protein [Clostridium saudiense]
MNKVEIKNFLGSEVRVVNNEYIVLKDMFNALGRVKEDGTWTSERKKMLNFLEGIEKLTDHETLVVTSKGKKKSREYQEVECLKIETVPVVLTQFKPTNRKGKEAIDKWFEFMKFVNELLVSVKAHNFIIEDTELEKIDRDRLHRLGGSPMKMATMVNYAMGVIITGEKIKISKPDLKSYQNQITIDLLEARRYWIEEFIRAYKITKSHSESNRLALEFTLEHYGLNEKVA